VDTWETFFTLEYLYL